MLRETWVWVSFNAVAFWLVAFLFCLPLRHKPGTKRNATACFVLGSALQIGVGGLLYAIPYTQWVMYLLYFALGLLVFGLCTDISISAVFYCTIWTIIVYRIGLQIAELLYIAVEANDISGMGRFFAIVAVVLLFYLIVGVTLARWMPENGRYEIGPRQMAAALISFAVFQVLVWVWETTWQTDGFSSMWKSALLMEIYCATLLYLQHEMFKKSALRRELDILNRMQAQQREQYALAKENIALINRKCHDLKHQVKAMRVLFEDEKREAYLKELEQAVGIYEAIAKTGNEVLDTVLTEKSLYCEANSIKAHCVADGRLLDFMDPVDLYTIFGNAMDNAIDSVKKIEQIEKRIIDVLVYQENQFLVIQIINPLEGELAFDEEGLPLTTKANNGYHGFGLKSIRHTVHRYNGFLTVTIENGCFCLRILLPLEQKREQ